MKNLRRLAAGLAVAAAAVTATTLVQDIVASPQDTTWGAPDTPADTTWGTPPANGPVITPLDTTWG